MKTSTSVALVVCLAVWSAAICRADRGVRFARDVRPILSEHCFQCHGPDENKREADLRLDQEESAKAQRDGHAAVVPADPDRSEVVRRITTDDPDLRMPPSDSGEQLTENEIETIRQWISEGAAWEGHWSFIPPIRSNAKPSRFASATRTPLDLYIHARLSDTGLTPSDEADKESLIRRVTLALTGLPPSPDEVDEFLADGSPLAYERVVERLLASPGYGERMAWMWLDAARYADTSGYQNDGPRSMWRWRDWVIDAFNANMPFDQFTIEQIAGDLLPNATRDLRIATGFNRNHRGNAEGGIIPEEYQVEYVVDRVDTTCTVWLGLTVACARCHDHKYDPLSQTEFYRLFAYFNNVPEYGRAIKEGNSPPYIQAPTIFQEEQLAQLDGRLAALEQQWRAVQDQLDQGQAAWESTLDKQEPLDWSITRGLTASFEFDSDDVVAPNKAHEAVGEVKPVTSEGTGRLEDAGMQLEPGPKGTAVVLDGKTAVEAGDVGNFGYFDKFSVALWVKPARTSGTIVSRMTDEEQGDGWYVQLHDGRVQVNLVKRWLDDSIRIETETVVPVDAWSHVAMSYDGSRRAGGIRVYLNGEPVKTKTNYDFLNQTFSTKEPLRIGGGNGPNGRFAGAIDELRVYGRVIEGDGASILATPDAIQTIAAISPGERTAGQRNKIRAYYVQAISPAEIRDLDRMLVELRDERLRFIESLPTVMVMEELPQPRETFVLVRGDYTKPGERVLPGVPLCLPAAEKDETNNRLALAKWLVARNNPLTARVLVNRIWQMHFGVGLVRTAEDFGVQGESPSHPELLDWLAIEFMDSGWDVKHLHRMIVLSATYRQSARVSAEQLAHDPDNRWLSRAPRVRYSAEMIRDQALAVSGLLVECIGGPSVKPYQPADLWKDLATDTDYDQDHGANLYRRSLYTYWKRTVAPPSMMTFDAAGREACQVRQSRTNTPLQALTLMNDVTYVEAARVMAQCILSTGQSPRDGLANAFRLATSRLPKDQEMAILLESLNRQQAYFQRDPSAAEELLSEGEYPRDARWNAIDVAAYTTVCSLILNLDEVITRQ